MIRQLTWLVSGVVGFWLLTLYPVYLLWGAFGLGYTSFSASVCFVTAAATLLLAERVRQQAPHLFRLTLLANGGLRMTMVLAAGLLATVAVLPKFPGSDPLVFWLTLLVFYLYTLVLETVLLLRGSMRQAP